MRLLFLCHRLPYPPNKGEKIRAFNILKYLAERHEIFLACLVDDVADLEHVGALQPYVRELLFERIGPHRHVARASSALLASRSITVSYFHSDLLQLRIDALIARQGIEGLLCSSSPMAEYLFRSQQGPRLASVRRVMDLIDVDSYKWRQYAERAAPWTAWIYRREARLLAALERRIAQEFDRLLLVSEQERRHLPSGLDSERVLTMPNGVDLNFFTPRYSAISDRPVLGIGPAIVFTGVMSYRPNVDAVVWFADRILPRVQMAVPQVQFCVVGSRPTRKIRKLGKRVGVTVTGYVNDVRPYLAAAAVCVAPLRIARGLQNKILEAMAMGRAVVATPAAFEGIDANPGHDLVVEDGEVNFAAALIEVLQNEDRRAQLGRNARACVERNYAWSAPLRLLEELFPSTHLNAAQPMTNAPFTANTRLSTQTLLGEA